MAENIALLFAGQGAQTPGMAKELVGNKSIDSLFAMAEKVCPNSVDIMFNGTAEELAVTVNTQPAMYLADLAYAIKAAEDKEVSAVCGFSVGEIPALAFANVFSYEDGLKIILKRAKFMQRASLKNGGSMVAVLGLSAQMVNEITRDIAGTWAANYNAPTQTVVACKTESIEALKLKVVEAKGKAIKLNVSGAFHCPLLEDAAKEFRTFLDTIHFNAPSLPVYANLTALPYIQNELKDTLSNQMCSPVLFNQTILNMKTNGITEFIEVGPGKVLSGLVKKII